jgi:hypothetical protein
VKNAHGAALAITWYPAKRQGVVEAAWRDPVLDDDLPLYSYRGAAVSAEALLPPIQRHPPDHADGGLRDGVGAGLAPAPERHLIAAHVQPVGPSSSSRPERLLESGLSTFWRAVVDVGPGAAAAVRGRCGDPPRPDSAATNRQRRHGSDTA